MPREEYANAPLAQGPGQNTCLRTGHSWGQQDTAGDSRTRSAPRASLPQGPREHLGVTAGVRGSNPTLEGAVGLLGQGEVLLTEQVHGLVLADLHAGAHVAVPMQEEGERAGQVLTAKATAEKKSEVQDFNKLVSFFSSSLNIFINGSKLNTLLCK